MKRQAFTLVELMLTIVVVVILAGFIPVFQAANSRPVHCSDNLKQIALSMLMYSGDHDSYFPVSVPGGQTGPESFDFTPLVETKYIHDGLVFNCGFRSVPAAGAIRSAYVYMASGIMDDNSRATEVSIARDESGNHPDDEWRNYLFVDGHVSGEKRP